MEAKSIFGQGIVLPDGINGIESAEPLTVCEALPLLEAMARRRTQGGQALPWQCRGALEHARVFGQAALSLAQQRAVRQAVFEPLADFSSKEFPSVPPGVEAAMLANAGVRTAFQAEDLIESLKDFAARRASASGDQEPRDLDRILEDLHTANKSNCRPPQAVASLFSDGG